MGKKGNPKNNNFGDVKRLSRELGMRVLRERNRWFWAREFHQNTVRGR